MPRGTRLLATLLLASSACVPALPAPGASPAPRAADGAPVWQRISCVSAIGSKADAVDELDSPLNPFWKTDVSKRCVPLGELLSSIPVPDAIPPIDTPRFYGFARADAWLQPQEPVIVVAEGAVARAYPLQILIWHEIVNDTVGGRPVAVTY